MNKGAVNPCAHREELVYKDHREVGTCSFCGQVKQYPPGGFGKAVILVPGNPAQARINKEIKKEEVKVDTQTALPKPNTAGMNRSQKNRILHDYYERNKQSINEDFALLGEKGMREKWGISPTGWVIMRARWMPERFDYPPWYFSARKKPAKIDKKLTKEIKVSPTVAAQENTKTAIEKLEEKVEQVQPSKTAEGTSPQCGLTALYMAVMSVKHRIVIPPEIQLGPHTYKIRFNEKLCRAADIRSQVSHSDQIIRLDPGRDKEMRRNTMLMDELLHEIIHPIDNMYCSGNISEQQIEALSAGLAQALLSLGVEFDFSQIPQES